MKCLLKDQMLKLDPEVADMEPEVRLKNPRNEGDLDGPLRITQSLLNAAMLRCKGARVMRKQPGSMLREAGQDLTEILNANEELAFEEPAADC